MKPLRMAVIGAGHLGRIHTRLLQTLAEVELVGVLDPQAAARQRAAEEFKVPVFADLAELPPLDAAVIASITTTHHALASHLLKQGVHVLVEKPLATTRTQAEDLVALAEENRCVLQVGHVERFNPALAAARPRLGTPLYFHAVRASNYTGRSTDIGVVHDLMIHDLDVVLSLVASRVIGIEAFGAAIIGPQEDMAQARIHFANGCLADLQASRTSYTPQRTMQIYSDRAFASLDFAAGTAELVTPSPAVERQDFAVEQLSAEEKQLLPERLFRELLSRESLVGEKSNAILEEQRDFVSSIQQAREPIVSGAQACRVLEVCEQIVAQVQAYRTRFGNMPARLRRLAA